MNRRDAQCVEAEPCVMFDHKVYAFKLAFYSHSDQRFPQYCVLLSYNDLLFRRKMTKIGLLRKQAATAPNTAFSYLANRQTPLSQPLSTNPSKLLGRGMVFALFRLVGRRCISTRK